MTEKYIEGWLELEKIVGEKANGVFAVPLSKPLEYDLGNAISYCKEKGIEIESFTKEDWEKFRIRKENTLERACSLQNRVTAR